MLSFMFAVLGSLMFWAVYIPVSFVISVFLMKKFVGPAAGMKVLSKNSCSIMKLVELMMLIVLMITWPAFIVFYILFKLILADMFWGAITTLVEKVEKAVPHIEVSFPNDAKKAEEPEK